MPNTEIQSSTEKVIVFRYQARTLGSNVVVVGDIVETTGFEALEFIMDGGLISTGLGGSVWSLVLEDSTETSNFVAIDPASLLTKKDNITVDHEVISVGYIGKKRFVRASIKRTGGAMTATIDSIGVSVVGAAPHHIPATVPNIFA